MLWNTSPSAGSPWQQYLDHSCMAWYCQILWWNTQHTCQYKIFEIPQPSHIIGFVFLHSRTRFSFLFFDKRKIDSLSFEKASIGILVSFNLICRCTGLRGYGRRSLFCWYLLRCRGLQIIMNYGPQLVTRQEDSIQELTVLYASIETKTFPGTTSAKWVEQP